MEERPVRLAPPSNQPHRPKANLRARGPRAQSVGLLIVPRTDFQKKRDVNMLKHGKWTLAVVAAGLALGLVLAGTSLAAKGGNGGNGGGKPGGGDEEVTRIPLKLILLAGQSNMSGSALSSDLETLAPELLIPQTDVPIWYTHGLWEDLQPGLGNIAYFGPELMFGRAMADALPYEHIALVKVPSAGNSLALDWESDTPGASWAKFLEEIADSVANLDPIYEPEFVGMLWSQGGRDAQFVEQALAYEANLTKLIQDVRAELGKPNLPFIIEHIQDNGEGTNRIFTTEVRDAQVSVSQNVANTGLVDTVGLTVYDNVHYDAAGQLDFGARFATEFLATAVFVPVAVDAVTYATAGRKGRDLVVSVNISELLGPSVNTFVSFTLDHESGSSWEASGLTDVDGNVTFSLSRAPTGDYTTTVTKLSISEGLGDWDGVTPANTFTK